MRKVQRLDAPAFLATNSDAWGTQWKQRHDANAGAQFHWHQIDGQPVNKLLLPLLKAQVQHHCSFCDIFPVDPPSNSTVEHFRPKAIFPLEAYKWNNLYYCCDACQRKGADFGDTVLRPDAQDYSFEKYFRWDFTTGMVKVNDQAPQADQLRADLTLKYFRLNEGHPRLRLREQYLRTRALDKPLVEFAYRDFVDAPSAPPVT
jgi:uncharacterized protein (TIGR02646 family)